jgi:electron transport complex protein RnfD
MDNSLILSSSPHIHTWRTSRNIMLDVIISLLPATAAGVIIFGYRAIYTIAACIATAVLSETIFNLITGEKQTIGDLSAVVTGLLLGLNVSTNVAIWQCVVGTVFAIVVVKCLFGGLGKNFANPAVIGRVFMLLAFSSVAGGAKPVVVGLTASATPLELIGTDSAPSLMELFLGLHGGAIGETCCLALLIGFAYLLIRKVIKWQVPVIFVGTVFVLYLLASGSFTVALSEILAGGLFLGAIFMATDYVTSPITLKGRCVFSLGCGIITFIIRRFCAYPEGVSFSILAMNILTPYIEKWTANVPLGTEKARLGGFNNG